MISSQIFHVWNMIYTSSYETNETQFNNKLASLKHLRLWGSIFFTLRYTWKIFFYSGVPFDKKMCYLWLVMLHLARKLMKPYFLSISFNRKQMLETAKFFESMNDKIFYKYNANISRSVWILYIHFSYIFKIIGRKNLSLLLFIKIIIKFFVSSIFVLMFAWQPFLFSVCASCQRQNNTSLSYCSSFARGTIIRENKIKDKKDIKKAYSRLWLKATVIITKSMTQCLCKDQHISSKIDHGNNDNGFNIDSFHLVSSYTLCVFTLFGYIGHVYIEFYRQTCHA